MHIENRNGSRWMKPNERWLRLDADGSTINYNQAACGDIVRDDKGKLWVVRLQKIWGTLPSIDLSLYKQMRLHKVSLFMDSFQAMQLLLTDCEPSHPLSKEIS